MDKDTALCLTSQGPERGMIPSVSGQIKGDDDPTGTREHPNLYRGHFRSNGGWRASQIDDDVVHAL
jgi:hypothetical protein